MKISESCCVDIDKLIPKIIWKVKRARIANTILTTKFKDTLSDFKIYYKSTVRQNSICERIHK